MVAKITVPLVEREIVCDTSAKAGIISDVDISKIFRTKSVHGAKKPTYASAMALRERDVKFAVPDRDAAHNPRDPVYLTRSPYDYENSSDRRRALAAANRIYLTMRTSDAKDEAFKIYDEIIRHTPISDLDNNRSSRTVYRSAAVALSEMYIARGTTSGVDTALRLLLDASQHFRPGDGDKCMVEYLIVKSLFSQLGKPGVDNAKIIQGVGGHIAKAKDHHLGVSFFADIVENLDKGETDWPAFLEGKVKDEPRKAYYYGKMLFKGAKIGDCEIPKDLDAAGAAFDSVAKLGTIGSFGRMVVDSRGYLAIIDGQKGGDVTRDINGIAQSAEGAGIPLKSGHCMGFYDIIQKYDVRNAMRYLEKAWARGVVRAKSIFRALYDSNRGEAWMGPRDPLSEEHMDEIGILPQPKVRNHIEVGPDGLGLTALTMMHEIESKFEKGEDIPDFFSAADISQAVKKGGELRRFSPGLLDLGRGISDETDAAARLRMSDARDFSGAGTSMVSLTPFSASGWSTHATGRPPVFFLNTAEVCTREEADRMCYVTLEMKEDKDEILQFETQDDDLRGEPISVPLALTVRKDGENVAVRFRNIGHKMQTNHFRRDELFSGRRRKKVDDDAPRPDGGQYRATLVQRNKQKTPMRSIAEHVAERAGLNSLKHAIYGSWMWGGGKKNPQQRGGVTETYIADPSFVPTGAKPDCIDPANFYDGELCTQEIGTKLALLSESGDLYLQDEWLDLYIKCLEGVRDGIEPLDAVGTYDVGTVLPRLQELRGRSFDKRREYACTQWGEAELLNLLKSCFDSSTKYLKILEQIAGSQRLDQGASMVIPQELFDVGMTAGDAQKLAVHNGNVEDIQTKFFCRVWMHKLMVTDTLVLRDFEQKLATVKNDKDRRNKICQVLNQFGSVDHVAHFSFGGGGQSLSNPEVLYDAVGVLTEFTKASAVDSRPGDFVVLVSDHGSSGFPDPHGFGAGETIQVDGKDYVRGLTAGGYACMNQFSSHGQTVTFTERLGVFSGHVRGDMPGEPSADHLVRQGAELLHEDHFLNLQASLVDGSIPEPVVFPRYGEGTETLTPHLIKERYRLTGWQSLSFDVKSGDPTGERKKSDRMMSQNNFYGPNYMPVCIGDLAFRAQTVLQRLAPRTLTVQPDTEVVRRGGINAKDASPLYPDTTENRDKVQQHVIKATADTKVLQESEAYRVRMVENDILQQQLRNLLEMMELEGVLTESDRHKVIRLVGSKDMDLDVLYTLSQILQENTVQEGFNMHNKPLQKNTMEIFRTRAELVEGNEDPDLLRIRTDIISSVHDEDMDMATYSIEDTLT